VNNDHKTKNYRTSSKTAMQAIRQSKELDQKEHDVSNLVKKFSSFSEQF